MKKSTKIIMVIVGMLLSLPPYAVVIMAILGKNISGEQIGNGVFLFVVSVFYWTAFAAASEGNLTGKR